MTKEQVILIQQELGLSDGKMAKALCVTRQTFRNWRTGSKIPAFVSNSLCWMMELRRIAPDNDNLPEPFRVVAANDNSDPA